MVMATAAACSIDDAPLELGISQMDDEHRKLVHLFDEFTRCVKDGGTAAQVGSIISQALDCANEHFEHEEALAESAHYPNMADEQSNHRILRLNLTTLAGYAFSTKHCDALVLEHLNRIRTLLREHIAGPDHDLAKYLWAKGYH
jgi:hemerythrin-like metal-binding protein